MINPIMPDNAASFDDRHADGGLNHIPPQNLEAEMALIGSILIDREIMPIAVKYLAPSDFYSPTHVLLYAALQHLFEHSKPLDKITLVDELRQHGQLERIGGPTYLSTLMETIPTFVSAEYYAKIIREKAMLRSLIAFGRRAQVIAFDGEEDVEGAIASVERELRVIVDRGRPDLDLDPAKQVEEIFAEVALAGERSDWLTSP